MDQEAPVQARAARGVRGRVRRTNLAHAGERARWDKSLGRQCLRDDTSCWAAARRRRVADELGRADAQVTFPISSRTLLGA